LPCGRPGARIPALTPVPSLFYIRLISLTAGTLVYLFLLALILGHRRPRFFERLLFFLVLSIFLIYAGGLLGINVFIQYVSPPYAAEVFSSILVASGLAFLPTLLVQVHIAYLQSIKGWRAPRWVARLLWSLYGAPLVYAVGTEFVLRGEHHSSLLLHLSYFSECAVVTLIPATLASAGIEFATARSSTDSDERGFFRSLSAVSLLIFLSLAIGEGTATFLLLIGERPGIAALVLGVLPGALLLYYAVRRNFLEYGAQRNLMYALPATFLALLYLALVRRVSGWLEPVLPPEATASVLLFVLIFLFEPLGRAIGPALHRQLAERMDRVQRLTSQLQQEARQGKVAHLVMEAERRIREGFGLAAVRISIPRDAALKALEAPGGLGHTAQMRLMKDGQEIGVLEAATTGSYLTGETSAALEFLTEQLPGMVDLARLIEDKLRLERELAERERMAVLGQMAASVSHNLRNPLSSMKTVLQIRICRWMCGATVH